MRLCDLKFGIFSANIEFRALIDKYFAPYNKLVLQAEQISCDL